MGAHACAKKTSLNSREVIQRGRNREEAVSGRGSVHFPFPKTFPNFARWLLLVKSKFCLNLHILPARSGGFQPPRVSNRKRPLPAYLVPVRYRPADDAAVA